MKRLTLATTICSVLALTACEDNTYVKQLSDSLDNATSSINNNPLFNNNNQTTTLAGKVADGYLIGAKVCLDKNQNDQCDEGEPHAFSTSGGNFELKANRR